MQKFQVGIDAIAAKNHVTFGFVLEILRHIYIELMQRLFTNFQINYFIDRDFVDIETPTEKSEPFDIHLFGSTAFLQTISLPIHFRYHAPGNKR